MERGSEREREGEKGWALAGVTAYRGGGPASRSLAQKTRRCACTCALLRGGRLPVEYRAMYSVSVSCLLGNLMVGGLMLGGLMLDGLMLGDLMLGFDVV